MRRALGRASGWRRLGTVGLALMGGLLALSAVTLEGTGPAQTPASRPNVVVVHDRRPDSRADAGASARARPDRSGRYHFHAELFDVPALLPLARYLPDRPIRPQPRRTEQRPARRRLRQARLEQHAPRVAR